MKVTVGNVCFIRNEQSSEILLLHRNREPMKDLWTGVGGKTGFDEDIHTSCLREVKEETGLDVNDLKLKGVVKTILKGRDSAWILFVYTATTSSADVISCDEGELRWVPEDAVYECNLVGFIRPILPHVLDDEVFLEGTIKHDMGGQVLNEQLTKHSILSQSPSLL